MTRWAVFKDFRGVAYCEPVNEGLKVFVKTIPARSEKRRWLSGKVISPARDKEDRIHVVFDEQFYSQEDYVSSAFDPAPLGYEYRPDICYMQENRWGPVQVILFIEDPEIAQRFQRELRSISPEAHYCGHHVRDNEAKPYPRTDEIIKQIRAQLK